MKVILDANVVIAAVASRGLCEAVMELCLERHTLILCEGLLKEIAEKLSHKLKVSPPVVTEYMKVLRDHAQLLVPAEVEMGLCRDTKDLMVLGLVDAAQAETIITGDKDLLVIRKYKTAQIVSPRNFWESNQKGK